MGKQRIRTAVLTVCALISFICGCGGAGGGSGSNQSAMLRVVNDNPGSTLNVIIDGTTVTTVIYSMCVNGVCTALGGYVTVKSGGVNFAVQQEGTTTNLVPPQFQNLNLQANTKNSFVLGSIDTTTGAVLFQDDDVPAANLVKVRVADVSNNVPTMSTWIVPTGTTPSGNPTISGVQVGSASSYITIPPNTYDIYLPGLNCGFDANCSEVTATLNANQNFTVYLLFEDNGSRALILPDN
jgi:hypothetical protein